MKSIYKYPFDLGERFSLQLPKDAIVLSVQMQGHQPCMWIMVDTANPPTERHFHIFGTGWAIPESGLAYCATFQEGAYVWHLFEETPE